jgi:HEAT repeat protein
MRRLVVMALTLLAAGCGWHSTDHWRQQLKDADVVKRRQAVRELAARPAEAERVVPALVEALGDDNGYVRHDAAAALGNFGPEAKTAVPALVAALADRERSVRTAAGAALRKIDPAAVPSAARR